MPDRPTICVIDDDDAIRDSLCFLLRSDGFNAIAFDSGRSFLAAFPEEPPGCIITDIQMPGISGIELVRRLSAEGRVVPAIVMTGRGDIGSAIESMQAGAFDFVEKPFNDEELLSAVRLALDQVDGEETRRASRCVERMQSLSGQERSLVCGLLRQQPHQALAEELGLAPQAIEVLRARIMSKLGTTSLVELVRLAVITERGW